MDIKFTKDYLKIFYSIPFKFFLFVLVFFFTFVLRAHNYDREPPGGHLEEMLYAWSGIYLVETGVPVSWSDLDYPKRAEVYRGIIDYHGITKTSVRLYKPWLDEPPLYSLVLGAFAHYHHADRHLVIPAAYIREPAVLISSLVGILVFLIAFEVSGFYTGILAMLLYGTIPTLVIGSRLAVGENWVTLFYTLGAYLLIKFVKRPNYLYLLLFPILAGLAGLGKPTGFFVLPIALYFAFAKKFYKTLIYMILGIIPFVVFFIWYGVHYDSQIFWHITSIQASRPVGFLSLAWFLISPAYDIYLFIDSWYVFGLAFAVYLIFSSRKEQILSLSMDNLKWLISFFFVYWLMVVMFTGGQTDLLPWYRYPAFPFLAIIIAFGLEYVVRNVNFYTSLMVLGLLLGGRSLVSNAFRPDVYALDYKIIFSLLILPSLVYTIYKFGWLENLSRVLVIGVIVIGIYYNVIYVYNQFELVCESKSCEFGPQTALSQIHFPIIWRFFTLGEPTLH